MSIIYSCVVDGNPKFSMQATNLVLSLRAVGVPPADIIVNLTPTATIHRQRFVALGCTTKDIPFFADGKYCNKVVQLRNAPDGTDFVVCCDTDIVFLANIAPDLAALPRQVHGKCVDFANPPIERLAAVFALFPEVPEPPLVTSDLDDEPTYAGNFNGGLYIIPGEFVRTLGATWEHFSLALYRNPQVDAALGNFAWHIDQISFCMALASLGLPCDGLSLEYNYPLHCQVPVARERQVGEIRVLHYHTAIDENSLPSPDRVQSRKLRERIALACDNLRMLWFLDARQRDVERAVYPHFTFVIGFHRSGTSLLTSACEHIGYSSGNGVLLGRNTDNPKGYFENRSLVKINEAIFRELESDWDDIFFSFDGRQAELSDMFLLQIEQLVEREFPARDGERYVLKDPRVMQTYGLWRSVLERLGFAKPEIIFVYRNPIECALSQSARFRQAFLEKRDPLHFFGKEVIETLLLWYSYTVRFLITLKEERIIFVRYEDLMTAPNATLTRLAAWAGTRYNLAEIERFARQFLEGGLRHHRSTVAELREACTRFPEIADLAIRLDRLCAKEAASSADIRTILDIHREQFAELLNLSFTGRLYAGAKRRWVQERYMRHLGQ